MAERQSDKAEEALLPPGEQQKLAWFSVVELLNELCPDWQTATKGSGTNKALAAIRSLAAVRPE